MTAEVAILNKSAVALAADSAVTLSSSVPGLGTRTKVYNTASKLFSLSTSEPIGIMVWQSSEFMGVPWESIIKVYRSII